MRKFLVKVLTFTLALSVGLITSYAFFTASNEVLKTYVLEVEAEGGVTFTQTDTNNGKLAPVKYEGGAYTDANGTASGKYYEVTYTVTTEKAKALKLTELNVSSELGKAVRVQTFLNGSERQFAPQGRTSVNAIGESVGVVNKTATLTVRIYLDGTDEACIDSNITDAVQVGVKFAI